MLRKLDVKIRDVEEQMFTNDMRGIVQSISLIT